MKETLHPQEQQQIDADIFYTHQRVSFQCTSVNMSCISNTIPITLNIGKQQGMQVHTLAKNGHVCMTFHFICTEPLFSLIPSTQSLFLLNNIAATATPSSSNNKQKYNTKITTYHQDPCPSHHDQHRQCIPLFLVFYPTFGLAMWTQHADEWARGRRGMVPVLLEGGGGASFYFVC
jgi:hypothetical protein